MPSSAEMKNEEMSHTYVSEGQKECQLFRKRWLNVPKGKVRMPYE